MPFLPPEAVRRLAGGEGEVVMVKSREFGDSAGRMSRCDVLHGASRGTHFS